MPVAGDKIRASDLGLFARKTATESVTSSTTLQDDDELLVSVEANSVYVLEAVFQYDGATTGDFKVGFTAPAGATLNCNCSIASTAATSGTAPGTTNHTGGTLATTFGGGAIGAGNPMSAVASGLLIVGGTAGTFRVQFAQFTSDATATRMLAGSFIHLRKVG